MDQPSADNGTIDYRDAPVKLHNQAEEFGFKQSVSGDHKEQREVASGDNGATSNGKREEELDALGGQPGERLKVENAANASSHSAGEPGTIGEVHREQTAGSDEDSCMLEVSDDEQGWQQAPPDCHSLTACATAVVLPCFTEPLA